MVISTASPVVAVMVGVMAPARLGTMVGAVKAPAWAAARVGVITASVGVVPRPVSKAADRCGVVAGKDGAAATGAADAAVVTTGVA
jgi:hypothetical protein